MISTNNQEKNILNIALDFIPEIRKSFYEILNLYTLQQYYFKENISIYNKVLKLDKEENKIETDPEKLLSKLILNLTSFNNILNELNSYSNINKLNFSLEININKEISFLSLITMNLTKYNPETIITSNKNFVEENIYIYLKAKQSLIDKYFKKLRIKYSKKIKKNKKEYIEIKIIVHNIFSIVIIFPSNFSFFDENNFNKNFKLVVKGIFGTNNEDNIKYNNYSNFQLYKRLEKILYLKFKEIIKNMKELYTNKISFYECFVLFLDFIYDYNKIFNIKCDKCFTKVKYSSSDKFFSVPLLKVEDNDKKRFKTIINDIEKGNKMDNKNKIFHFFHQECIFMK